MDWLLLLLGAAFIVAAAFLANVVAGLAVLGVALMVAGVAVDAARDG